MNQDGHRFGDFIPVDAADGVYELVLTSVDELHKPAFQATQKEEQWVLEAFDKAGEFVFTTKPISDLPEDQSELVESVGSYDFDGVASVRARHLGRGGINSVVPRRAELKAPDCEDATGEATARGLVVDPDGAPVSGIEVVLDNASNDVGLQQSDVTDDDGQYSFDVRAGCWTASITVFDERDEPQQLSVDGCVEAGGALEFADLVDPNAAFVPSVEPREVGERYVVPPLSAEEVQEQLALGVQTIDFVRTPAPAGEVVHEGGFGLEQVRVVIDSSGGLHDTDVWSAPDDQLLIGLGKAAAGPVVDIQVSDPDAVIGATLTLPYADEAVVLGAESDLRIAWFDEENQLWMPTTGAAQVDTANNTVTAEVDHFTRFAVVQGLNTEDPDRPFWSAAAINEFFGNVAAFCVAENDAASAEVVLAIDNSLSMDSNDPSDRRVDAATAFLGAMADRDYAGVVTFGFPARTAVTLMQLDAASRTQVQTAINSAAATVPTGTDLSGAVALSLGVLAGGLDRNVQVIVLLTDGEHAGRTPYDPSAVAEAASRSIPIFTVGLGGSTDTALLQSIAETTGGRYFAAPNASDLESIYDELAGDLIDSGEDSDGDTLTDCEEENGLFTPWVGFDSDVNRHQTDASKAAFIRTNPNLIDSDEDGSDDNEEAIRVRFIQNTEIAETYQNLIDGGIEEYFRLTSGQPNLRDTDSDGLDDPVFPRRREVCGERLGAESPSPFFADSDGDQIGDLAECENTTNPLRGGDPDARGIPGLTSTTLFAPEAYNNDNYAKPPVSYRYWIRDNGKLGYYFMESAIYYDDDYNCVGEGCELLEDWAADTEDDSRLCRWLGASCEGDEQQIRNKIDEIVEFQGVFNDDGFLENDYLALDAYVFCATQYEGCIYDNIEDTIDEEFDEARVAPPLVRPPDVPQPNPTPLDTRSRTVTKEIRLGRVTAIAAGLSVAAAGAYRVFRDALATPEERRDRIERARKTCKEDPNVLAGVGSATGQHPCDLIPIFLPSVTDVGRAAIIDAEHILTHPTDVVLNYNGAAVSRGRISAELEARGLNVGSPREWYNQFPACNDQARAQWLVANPGQQDGCQEYPFFSTAQSGPRAGDGTNDPYATIEVMRRDLNTAEGSAFGAMRNACPTVRSGEPFLVVPQILPGSEPTDWVCNR